MSYYSTGATSFATSLVSKSPVTSAMTPLVSKAPTTRAPATTTSTTVVEVAPAPGLLSRKNIMWGVAVGILAIGGAMYLRKRRKKSPAAAPAPAGGTP